MTATAHPGADRTGHARIAGIGTYRPRRVVTNEEVCERIDSSPEWILRRSGINARRFAQPDETLLEMAAAAGEKALADAGVDPADVDQLLVASMSDVFDPPGTLPAAIAERMGLRVPTVAVAAACSGFAVALGLADTAVSAGNARNCLVIGVERMSDIIDPTDRSTAFIFSDGAGAVLVERSAEPGIGPLVWGSDPSKQDAIAVRPTGQDGAPILHMAGSMVFRWAMTELPGVVERIMELAGVTAEDVRAFIPHQANVRITNAVAEAVRFGEHVVIARDIADQGNTSAASIPMAMERLRLLGEVASGDLAVLVGFGAGLGYAGMVVAMP